MQTRTLLASLAALTVAGSASAVSPYDVAYAPQWSTQLGGDSNRTDGRGGSVLLIGDKVIYHVESQDNTFGANLGGLSITSGFGVYDKLGNKSFEYMYQLDSLDADSQNYAPNAVTDGTYLYVGGHTRHEWPGAPVPINNNAGIVQKRDITNGNHEWSAIVDEQNGPLNGWMPGTGVAIDSTGATWLTGYTNSPLLSAGHPGNYSGTGGGDYDPYLVKVNPDGTLADIGIQPTAAGNDRPFGVAVDPNNDNIIAMTGWSSGYAASDPALFGDTYGGGSRDGFVAIYDASGTAAGDAPTLVYGQMLKTADRDAFYSVAFAPDGDLLVGGYYSGENAATQHQIAIEKIDVDGSDGPVGASVWTEIIDGGADSVDLMIRGGFTIDDDGNLYVSAYTQGAVEGANGGAAGTYDAFVRKYAPSGSGFTEVWTNQLPFTENQDINGSTVSGDKTEVYIVGGTRSDLPTDGATISGGEEAYMFKLVPGDFNTDGVVDQNDVDLADAAVSGLAVDTYDFDEDGDSDRRDISFFWFSVLDEVVGDTDGDGDVDGVDVSAFFSGFTGPGVGANPQVALGAYKLDTDIDGDVDGVDLAAVFSGFTGPLAPANVPEPTSLALLGLGGLLVARRRRA